MNLAQRVVLFLFTFFRIEHPFAKLLTEARRHGKVTLAETELEAGRGWYVTIRPDSIKNDPTRAHRYTWSGESISIDEALREAIEESTEYPDMQRIDGAKYAPKLGGKEFDE